MENTKTNSTGLNVSTKSFLVSIGIIAFLWIGVYIATFFIPSGEFTRIINSSGYEVVDPSTFKYVDTSFPFWKFLLSPFLLFGSSDGTNIILILVFLFIVSASMCALNKAGIMNYVIEKISNKFCDKKYVCLAVIIFFFMMMGSFVGSFEEVVPFIPVMVTLSLSFGWDIFTGIAMCLIADACGFSAGIMNPFTVGIAQQICVLPMFSGVLLRIVCFVLIYLLFFSFMFFYVKRLDKKNEGNAKDRKNTFQQNEKFDKAALSFLIIMGIAIVLVISSSFFKALQSITIVFMALGFLVSGIVCPLIVNMSVKDILKNFGNGVISMLPAILMILLASSIKFILVESKSLDTILNSLINATNGLSPIVILLFIYLIVLFMNFFIPSGSAKAFLIMPLIGPIALINNVPLQLCVLAFAFGDGFSNVLYPTNPVLLIGLNLVGESYGSYFKKIALFQLLNLMLTCGILVIALLLGAF